MALPEARMRDPLGVQPAPVGRAPPARIGVAARLDELEVLLVGDIVPVDLERGDVHPVRRPFVVPRERDVGTIDAERDATRRHVDPRLRRRDAAGSRLVAGGATLPLAGQLVPHVEQRLLVHRLVLEDGEDRLGAIEQRVPRLVDVAARDGVEHTPIRLVGELAHDVAPRPFERRRAGDDIRGIDPTGEEPLERRVDARASEPFLDERVETERRQMAVVEHDRVAQRDRLAVVGRLIQKIEEAPGTVAVASVPRRERETVELGRR